MYWFTCEFKPIISNNLKIPIRNENISNIKSPDVLYKGFTINNVNIESLKEMVLLYKDKNVVVELMTHPGFIDEYTKSITSYLNRELELNVLKEAMEIGIFNEIELINFRQFWSQRRKNV